MKVKKQRRLTHKESAVLPISFVFVNAVTLSKLAVNTPLAAVCAFIFEKPTRPESTKIKIVRVFCSVFIFFKIYFLYYILILAKRGFLSLTNY
jgi:hypothetical protein